MAGGLCLALQHPLAPALAVAAFLAWVALLLCRPRAWLFVLPAVLPIANLSPWTGWICFDEFDFVLLGVIAAGHTHAAARANDSPSQEDEPKSPWFALCALAFASASTIALYRGWMDIGRLSLFQGYTEPLNSIRLFKPVVYLAALWPLTLSHLRQSVDHSLRRVAAGMVGGLAAVSLIAFWERAAYPGLLDYEQRYRITAWFWEMHVGGGAIDVYLALAAPFALWALCSARTMPRWVAAALLALLAAYACLTTFSRGVYLGVGLPLLALGVWLSSRRRGIASRRWLAAAAAVAAACAATTALLALAFVDEGYAGLALACAVGATLLAGMLWQLGARRTSVLASGWLVAAMLAEIVVVFSPESFMRERIAAGDRDFGSRLAHWRHGIALLRGADDLILGIGLGQLPARYAASAPRGEFSGAIALPDAAHGSTGAVVRGPATNKHLAGLYGLTQRVPIGDGGPYRVSFAARAKRPTELDLRVCEMHLLYERRCQAAQARIVTSGAHWQSVDIWTSGHLLSRGAPYAPREGVFWLSVATAGGEVEIDQLSLRNSLGAELIDNGSFTRSFAHWFPSAVGYFVPWHIDNLYLELFIERGMLGLAGFLGLLACVLKRLSRCAAPLPDEMPFFVASAGGALIVGAVSSVMDTPRLAFMMLWCLLLLWESACLGRVTPLRDRLR